MSATEAPLPGEDTTDVRPGRGPAPEIIGAAIAVIVLAVIGTAVLAGGGRPAVAGPSSSPATAETSAAPTPELPVDPQVVALLHELNQELVASAQALQKELDRATLRTADVATEIRLINQRVAFGADKVKALGGALGKNEPGGKLGAVYSDIAGTAAETLKASINNAAAYRIGAGALIKEIGTIPPIQDALEALLLVSPSPSLGPSPSSAAPSTAAPPSATPTPAPTPTPTAEPSGSPEETPSPSPIAAGPEQVTNGGFESGLPPWQLLLTAGAAATPTIDPASPATGKASARVDISASSDAYGGITLQQAGLDLQAGGLYTLVLSAKATTDRDVRIRVASTTGDAYLTRLVTVGPAWVPSSFTFTAPISDPNGVLEIELGRSTVTTWIDDVSFRPSALAP